MHELHNKVSLRIKIILIALSYSLIITIFLSMYQFYISYNKTNDNINNLVKLIDTTSIENLTMAVWRFDDGNIKNITDSILSLNYIYSVKLLDTNKKISISKQLDTHNISNILDYILINNLNHTYRLNYNKQTLGYLEIEFNKLTIADYFLHEFIYYTLQLIIFLMIILFIIERTFYAFITKPIEKLSQYVSNIDIKSNKYNEYPVSIKNKEDEIGLLINRFNITFKSLFGMKDQLLKMATIDALTSLPNRNSLDLKFNEIDSLNHEYFILLMDLDDFKDVNDLLGHDIGDFVLITISNRIEKLLKDNAFIYRLGGDEFVIIFKHFLNKNQVINLLKDIINICSTEINTKKRPVKLTTSIGVSIYPKEGKNKREILKRCDIAMYEAKNKGGNQYLFYAKEMENKIIKERAVFELLEYAITNSTFLAYYQAKVCSKSKKIVSYELLVRLKDKNNNIIFPDKFIDIAEKSRQIIDIGKWVMKEGMKKYSEKFIHEGIKTLAINVSIIQLKYDKNFIDYCIELKKDYGIKDNVIEIEITESFFIDDMKLMVEKLKILKDNGFKITIDDFGTGYSSLSYIQDLPLDTLKIDKSFVDKIPNDSKIALTIIALAKNLNLEIVAEGVENIQQSNWLEDNGVDYIQGYLYSKPKLL